MNSCGSFLLVVLLLLLCACSQNVTRAAEQYRVVETMRIADEPACAPAATRADDGSILVAFGTNWEPMPPISVLKLTRSSDGGKTWSKPQVLWDPEAGGANVNSGMTTLRSGIVLLPCSYREMPQ